MNSKTGFVRDAAQTDRYNILVEISGVNRKQTEIAVNVPRSARRIGTPLGVPLCRGLVPAVV